MDTTTDSTTDVSTVAASQLPAAPKISGDACARLGTELRSLYAVLCDAKPIPDTQIDLLLQLRHRERDRRRVA